SARRNRAPLGPLHAGVDVPLDHLVERARARCREHRPEHDLPQRHEIEGRMAASGEQVTRAGGEHHHHRDAGLGEGEIVAEAVFDDRALRGLEPGAHEATASFFAHAAPGWLARAATNLRTRIAHTTLTAKLMAPLAT